VKKGGGHSEFLQNLVGRGGTEKKMQNLIRGKAGTFSQKDKGVASRNRAPGTLK